MSDEKEQQQTPQQEAEKEKEVTNEENGTEVSDNELDQMAGGKLPKHPYPAYKK